MPLGAQWGCGHQPRAHPGVFPRCNECFSQFLPVLVPSCPRCWCPPLRAGISKRELSVQPRVTHTLQGSPGAQLGQQSSAEIFPAPLQWFQSPGAPGSLPAVGPQGGTGRAGMCCKEPDPPQMSHGVPPAQGTHTKSLHPLWIVQVNLNFTTGSRFYQNSPPRSTPELQGL